MQQEVWRQEAAELQAASCQLCGCNKHAEANWDSLLPLSGPLLGWTAAGCLDEVLKTGNNEKFE